MPKVSRFARASHRETSVGRFLQQSSAFPAQVRKVSFEDTSCSNSSCNIMESKPVVAAASSSTTTSSCSPVMYPSIEGTSSTVSHDEEPSRGSQEVDSSMSPLHRSTAYESLNEQQFQLQQQQQQQQDRSKRLLRRPTTSFCLSDLASSAQQSSCEEEDLTLSPQASSSRPSPVSSPWGHFVDVIPMDGGDCNSYSLPSSVDSDNLEDAYFHPDTLLFWSQCSDNSRSRSSHRKSSRFEPYTTKKSFPAQRISRKPSPTEAFSNDFMLPPSHFSSSSSEQPYVSRSMRLTREVEETMERLHF